MIKLSGFTCSAEAFGKQVVHEYDDHDYEDKAFPPGRLTIRGLTIAEAQVVVATLAKCGKVTDLGASIFGDTGLPPVATPAAAEAKPTKAPKAERAAEPEPEPAAKPAKATKAEKVEAKVETKPEAKAEPSETKVVKEAAKEDDDDLMGAAEPAKLVITQGLNDCKKISHIFDYVINTDGIKTAPAVVKRILDYRAAGHEGLGRVPDLEGKLAKMVDQALEAAAAPSA